MENSRRSPFETARSGLWLLIDIVDDLLEHPDIDAKATTVLLGTRAAVTDLLFEFRRLENAQTVALDEPRSGHRRNTGMAV